MSKGITRQERSLFDEALNYFKQKQELLAPGCVLRFRGVPVDTMVWSERDRIRVVLEYQKEMTGIVSRDGHVTVFPPSMSAGSAVNGCADGAAGELETKTVYFIEDWPTSDKED